MIDQDKAIDDTEEKLRKSEELIDLYETLLRKTKGNDIVSKGLRKNIENRIKKEKQNKLNINIHKEL